MIAYNVKRRWFEMKGDAEAYRIAEGLKPDATIKVEVADRAGLAALLNALCEPAGSVHAPEGVGLLIPERVALVGRAFVSPDLDIPDCVPDFLLSDDDRRRRREARP